ncbi:MAG: glucose-6-phosphate isomerase, partial [Campylobacterales bacterium]
MIRAHFTPAADLSAVVVELKEKLRAERDGGSVGYYHLPQTMLPVTEEINNWLSHHPMIKENRLKDVVVLGIGGSSLGPKAVDAMLNHSAHRNSIRLTFLENLDPLATMVALRHIDAKNSLFLVISKSGSTIETLSLFKVVLTHFGIALEKSHERVIYITDEGSALDQLGQMNGNQVFHIPVNVGGRFSVLSPVGLVPMALLGYDIKALLEGSRRMIERHFSGECETILTKAATIARESIERPITVLFSYASSLSYFNSWFVQLWGESLGKIDANGRHVGLTPVGLVGSVDQHSFLQLLMEGPRDKRVTIIKVIDFGAQMVIPSISIPGLEKADFANGRLMAEVINAQADATMEALQKVGVPVDL